MRRSLNQSLPFLWIRRHVHSHVKIIHDLEVLTLGPDSLSVYLLGLLNPKEIVLVCAEGNVHSAHNQVVFLLFILTLIAFLLGQALETTEGIGKGVVSSLICRPQDRISSKTPPIEWQLH